MDWKNDFLMLEDNIDAFIKKHLPVSALDFVPPPDNPSQGNVGLLLHYHLLRVTELLWAEIQGNLEESYQDEIDALRQPKEDGKSELDWLKEAANLPD